MSGTRVNGEIAGKEADVISYSFQAVKNLPTGDSGMICFKDADCDAIVRKKAGLASTRTPTPVRSVQTAPINGSTDVEYVGYKYNGNAVMAAIALAQLPHLERDNAYRRQLAEWYAKGFEQYPDKIKLVGNPWELRVLVPPVPDYRRGQGRSARLPQRA
jgi:dTDP-4-amino-4,6-dideoxygalactose transaminase